MQLITLIEGPAQPRLPLVLIHGWGHNSNIWRRLLASFTSSRLVYGINLPGFDNDAEFDVQPSNLCHTLAELTHLLPEACILLGWSLGGMLACQLAQSSKVKGLLTLAANPSFIARPHWPCALAPEVLEQFKQSFSEDPAATLQRFTQMQAQGQLNRKACLAEVKTLTPPLNAQAWAQALSWLGEIDNTQLIPTLAKPQRHLFAEKDALVPIAVAESCPHSRCVPGGHLLPLEGLDAINQALSEIDRAQNRTIAQSFSRAACDYDQHAILQQRLGGELLAYLNSAHTHILDLGCGTGFISRNLHARSPEAWVVNLDLAWGMLQALPVCSPKLQADAEQLPFAAATFDAITANLALQWCDLPAVLAEAKRCLAPGGILIFNTLAEGTLGGIARAWAEVDDYPHINSFPSQQSILTQCQAAGFSRVHWHATTHTVQAPSLKELLMSIKGIGAKNQQPQRFKGLVSASHWGAFSEAMHKHAWDGTHWFVTYEVLTLCLQV
ncbi:MAG TPA: alpha/beta fold hydrolase [Cellvibrionaceae bacterium]